ncbi:MAG: NAD(P)H-binding protein [Chryseolinea sp.]
MMKYVITGSIGHISKEIVVGLIKNGKQVSVITSSHDRVKEIESLGAKALVGALEDQSFVKKAYAGAEVVYTMSPPIWVTDNWRASQNVQYKSMTESIIANKVKYVVNLSSIGAEHKDGCGPVNGIHDFEVMLNAIPELNVKHLRPAYFFHNFLAQIGMIKGAGIMGGNFGGSDQKLLLTAYHDIAVAAVEELLSLNFKGTSHRYIVSDIRTTADVTKVLGAAVAKELPWIVFTDKDQAAGMLQAGLAPEIVKGYVEMGKALREGLMQTDVLNHLPPLGSIKLESFAKEFAAAFYA